MEKSYTILVSILFYANSNTHTNRRRIVKQSIPYSYFIEYGIRIISIICIRFSSLTMPPIKHHMLHVTFSHHLLSDTKLSRQPNKSSLRLWSALSADRSGLPAGLEAACVIGILLLAPCNAVTRTLSFCTFGSGATDSDRIMCVAYTGLNLCQIKSTCSLLPCGPLVCQ